MVSESVAIVCVWLVLLVALLRAKHIGYAVAVLPITFVPVLHLAARGVLVIGSEWFFGTRPAIVLAFADFLAVAITCAAIVLLGSRINSKRNRRIYLITMISYTVLLGWAYIFDSLQTVLV